MPDVELAAGHLEIVRRILAEQVPEAEVRAFGSRVTGGSRRYSDLDLAVTGSAALDLARLSRLEEAFSLSDLPIRVDVLDWHWVSPAFRRVIEENSVVIQEAAAGS